MAFKFIVLCSLLAITQAGVIGPVVHQVAYANPAVDAVASTHQNVVRSFGGTVSQYSKAIETPYSSVRKEDTRISKNYFTPAIAKTVTYAVPAKTFAYATPAVSKTITYEAPAVPKTAVAAPLPTAAVYTHAAPTVSKTVYAPAPAPTAVSHVAAAPSTVYTHAAPIAKTVTYTAPAVTSYNHGPAATTYTHNAPGLGLSGYGSSQRVQYSPAEMVSHMSFDGFGTHWGW